MIIRFGEYMIRDWREDDAPGIVKYANNRKISKNLREGFPHPYTTNPASAKVLERAGFLLEWIMRANVFKDGKVLNQYLYARVKVPVR